MTNNMNWLANLTKAVGDVRPLAQQARTWHSQLAQTYGLLATVTEYVLYTKRLLHLEMDQLNICA